MYTRIQWGLFFMRCEHASFVWKFLCAIYIFIHSFIHIDEKCFSSSLSHSGSQTNAMCDSTSNSEILNLTGEPSITSAPPLILLQSEEESTDQGKSSGVDGATGVVHAKGNCESSTTQTSTSSSSPNQSLLPSSHNWSSVEGSRCAPTTSAVPDALTQDQVLSEVGSCTFKLN